MRRGTRSWPRRSARRGAADATRRILFHRGSRRSLLGSLAYLGFDALVLWTAFLAIHANPVPGFGAVLMAYIIGALGGSIPLPAGIGAVGGIAGMLMLYGVGRNAAIAAVLLYEAVGLLVPLIGGGLAYRVSEARVRPDESRAGRRAPGGPKVSCSERRHTTTPPVIPVCLLARTRTSRRLLKKSGSVRWV